MNIKLLKKIAEWLEAGAKHGPQFDMSTGLEIHHTRSACGTTCCIAGAATWFGGARIEPDWDDVQEEAARVVRHLIKTGKVDWSVHCG